MQIITISGQARVGKTTTAKFIAEEGFKLGYKPILLPFAGPIKDSAKEKGLCKDKNSEEYRDYCQHLGKIMRDDNPDYWVNQWYKKLQQIQSEEMDDLNEGKKYWERLVIVDDCRYLNELSKGKKLKAIQIFVTAGSRTMENADAAWRTHESELLSVSKDMGRADYQDLFTTTLINETTEENLRQMVIRRIKFWLGLECQTESKCSCELCKARREQRIPDIESVIDDLIDRLFGDIDEEA